MTPPPLYLTEDSLLLLDWLRVGWVLGLLISFEMTIVVYPVLFCMFWLLLMSCFCSSYYLRLNSSIDCSSMLRTCLVRAKFFIAALWSCGM